MRLVQPDHSGREQSENDGFSFEEPENKLRSDLEEARRYTELDQLLYRVLQLHAIYQRRVDEGEAERTAPLQRQLAKAQQRLDQLFDNMR